MHDAKASLHEAEKLLDDGRSAGVQQLIDKAIDFMNKAPSDARVNWARVHYLTAVNLLTSKLASTANKK